MCYKYGLYLLTSIYASNKNVSTLIKIMLEGSEILSMATAMHKFGLRYLSLFLVTLFLSYADSGNFWTESCLFNHWLLNFCKPIIELIIGHSRSYI
jgi:hypothetical protein